MFNERGQVCMNEQDGGLQSRLVVDLKRDGRRKYDENAKREGTLHSMANVSVSVRKGPSENRVLAGQ